MSKLSRHAGLILLCLVLAGCTTSPVSGDGATALSPTDLSGFPAPQRDFARHVQETQDYIARRQLPHRKPEDVEYNSPFEVQANPDVPYRGLFLYFHGLNDSPYVWRDFAESMSSRGFDGRAVLLPGFGTTPEQLLKVSYKQWLSAAREHLQLALDTGKPVYLGGFSLGGVLATLLALETSSVEGLLLVSPAYQSKLDHLLRWGWAYQKFEPWLFGGMIIEDNPSKYNSISINSGTQYYRTARQLKRRWNNRKIDLPVVMVATADDSVVDIGYMQRIYRKRFNGERRRFILYSADENNALVDTEVRRNSAYLDERLLNQSHLSLINRDDNELYGRDGNVLVCNGNEPRIFFACLDSPKHWFGAQHTPSPDGVAVARSTYNPDFDYIVQSVDEIFPGGPTSAKTSSD